ncbi:unnamed protein product, partial [Sphacelaria rigidula]
SLDVDTQQGLHVVPYKRARFPAFPLFAVGVFVLFSVLGVLYAVSECLISLNSRIHQVLSVLHLMTLTCCFHCPPTSASIISGAWCTVRSKRIRTTLRPWEQLSW